MTRQPLEIDSHDHWLYSIAICPFHGSLMSSVDDSSRYLIVSKTFSLADINIYFYCIGHFVYVYDFSFSVD